MGAVIRMSKEEAELPAVTRRFIEARRKAGLSQSEVARHLGISRAAVSSWEAGHTEPSSANLRAVAKLLNVGAEYLATGTDGLVTVTSEVEGKVVPSDHLPVHVKAGLANRQEVWKIDTNVIAAAGYREGDMVVVTVGARAAPGSVVLAMKSERGAQTPIFRVYFPPMLVAAAMTPIPIEPIVVDNVKVTIRGPVTTIIR